MDERLLQQKQLKKAYKKLRAKAGLGWRIPGYLLIGICVIVSCITVFVLGRELSWVRYVDAHIWQPVKSALPFPLPGEMVWDLAESYGGILAAATGFLGIICVTVGGCKQAAVKKTDAYLNYRTMKLTLETEKEEQ